MTHELLIFHCTHEEEQDIILASSFFTFQLTTKTIHILTCHLTMQLYDGFNHWVVNLVKK